MTETPPEGAPIAEPAPEHGADWARAEAERIYAAWNGKGMRPGHRHPEVGRILDELVESGRERPAPSHPVASNVQPGVDLSTGEDVVDPAVAARDEAVDRMAGFYEEDGNLDAADRVRARFEEPDTTETPGGTTATTR